jgi:hypothetical protein
MAFSTSTIKPATPQAPVSKTDNATIAASLLSMLLLGAYAAKQGKKSLRKMKRHLMWNAFKLKMKSLFSKKETSDRTLLLILLGVICLALILIEPVVGLIVLLLILVLYLLGVFKI